MFKNNLFNAEIIKHARSHPYICKKLETYDVSGLHGGEALDCGLFWYSYMYSGNAVGAEVLRNGWSVLKIYAISKVQYQDTITQLLLLPCYRR
jgi:hypothetical protein